MMRCFVSIAEIVFAVAEAFGVPASDIMSSGRGSQQAARARQSAMWLAVRLTGLSYAAIGGDLGGRDRTTVRHGCRSIEEAIGVDAGLAETIDLLRLRLSGEVEWIPASPAVRAIEAAISAFERGLFAEVRSQLKSALRELAPASPMLWEGS